MDREPLWQFRFDSDPHELLRIVGFDPTDLRKEAEWLLRSASTRDPMKDWWPVLRRSNESGWSKLKGVTRDCVWQRIAAEILLRAHEDLAERDIVEPRPDLTGARWHDCLLDRVTPRESDAESLERALAKYGLSPHPRVLLLLEGQTEMVHVRHLLKELELDRPDRVRLQNCRTSRFNPQLISRYAIAPRLGPRLGEHQLLEVPPTALVIAMDPENGWRTQDEQDEQKRKLQEALREEVVEQGGTISQEDLDFLINIHVWGEDTYELANFADDELVPAITQLAQEQSVALRSVEFLQAERDCTWWAEVSDAFGPGGVVPGLRREGDSTVMR